MNPSLPSLSTMLGDLPLQRLVSEHWNRRPLHVRGPVERLRALPDREALLARIRGSKSAVVAAYFPDPDHSVTLRTGVRPVIDIAPNQVDAALSAGAAIVVRDLEALDEGIAAWMRDLRRELGFVGRVGCAALLGTSYPPHFDTSAVISVQLAGRKTWRVSREPALVLPAGEAKALPDGSYVYMDRKGKAERRHDWEFEAQPFDAANAEVYDLAPGDALFVPAGCWHATEPSHEPNFSLSIAFVPIDLCGWIAQALEPVLNADPAWRELPPQPGAGGGEMPLALRDFLADRLADLSRALTAPGTVDHVLHRAFTRSLAEPPACMPQAPAAPAPSDHAPLHPDDVLAVRNPAQWTCVDARDAEGRPFVEIFTGQREILFDEPDILPFGRALAKRTRFAAGDATRWAGDGQSYPWEQVQDMLSALVDDGALEVESRAPRAA